MPVYVVPATAAYQLYIQICNFHTSICTFDTFRPFSTRPKAPRHVVGTGKGYLLLHAYTHTHSCIWDVTLTFTATLARAQPVGFVDEIAAGYYFELS